MRIALRAAWAVGFAVVIVALLRVFVADVYPVISGSMEPTLAGPGPAAEAGGAEQGERVLVLLDGGGPARRWELVVLRRGDGRQAVKRVVALPGERVQLVGGDLWIDGRRPDEHPARPGPLPVFDAELHALERYFFFEEAPLGPWRRPEGTEDAWQLDARGVPSGADSGLMLYHKDLDDGWVDRHGRRVAGRFEVNDARLECEFRLDAPGGRLRLKLVEEGDTFEAVLSPGQRGRGTVELLRWNQRTLSRGGRADPRPTIDRLGTRELPLAEGGWHRLALANIDDRLSVHLDGALVLEALYDGNEPHPRATPGTASPGVRAGLGGEGILVSFRRIRLLRDAYWAPVGKYAVEEPLQLGPDEYFVLGDNSGDSLDSRATGPIRAAELLGRPLAVVWPPTRARWLGGGGG